VLVAEVRETSRKPDEMYALLERLSPGTRKLEVSVPDYLVLGPESCSFALSGMAAGNAFSGVRN
jgi:N6-adenosine-specific RNA methylase IME4